MAHWVWGGGWIQQMGALDFAGGTVVHINAGISALVMAIMLGCRRGYKKSGQPLTPNNTPFVFIGTALLWVGWFGFEVLFALYQCMFAVITPALIIGAFCRKN